MARYIDADELYKKIFQMDVVDKRHYSINAKAAAEAIDKTPTADVAPKSEVDRLRFNLKAVLDERAEDKAKVAREIFEELRKYIINHCYLADDDVDAIWKHIEKLEKRYKEDNQ